MFLIELNKLYARTDEPKFMIKPANPIVPHMHKFVKFVQNEPEFKDVDTYFLRYKMVITYIF